MDPKSHLVEKYYTEYAEKLVAPKMRVRLGVTVTASGENATSVLWTLTGRTECLRTE
jgi:hypothetical protein